MSLALALALIGSGCVAPGIQGRLVSTGFVANEDDRLRLHAMCGYTIGAVRVVQNDESDTEGPGTVVWWARADSNVGVDSVELFVDNQSGLTIEGSGNLREGSETYVYFELIPVTNEFRYVLIPDNLKPGEVAWGDRRMKRQDFLDWTGGTFQC
jgi:hypothetical protein